VSKYGVAKLAEEKSLYEELNSTIYAEERERLRWIQEKYDTTAHVNDIQHGLVISRLKGGRWVLPASQR
jgi:hypothetical protein